MHVQLKGSTVDECIAYHCSQQPDAHCFSLWSGGEWRAYQRAEFWKEVERYSALFASHFPTQSLILFIKRLDLALLAAYIGAIKAGHLPAQLSPLTTKATEAEYRRKLAHILDLTGAAGIFCDQESLLGNAGIKVLTPSSPTGPYSLQGRPCESALVQFSSGSTGLQKGVTLTHQSIVAHMRRYGTALELTSRDVLVSWLPLYHDMGLIACFLLPLMWGIPFFQMDPFDWIMRPNLLLETIEQKRATLCFLPNFAYHVLINKGRAHDLSSMRLFINCSEPAREATHHAFQAKFPTVVQEALSVCYALAENTFAVSQTPPGKPATSRMIGGQEIMSCGRILPGTEVVILDPDKDGIGEIGIRGEHLFERFLGASVESREGLYPTGDLGQLLEGELFITGRKKDLIISNGKNIYPQDVEHVCSSVSGVYPGRSVAFGISNEESGSEDVVVVVERDGSVDDTPLKITVQKAVELEVGVVPKRVVVVEHMRLVKTSSGKISRSRNKELFLRGELR